MRWLFLGAGALGGFYGGRLLEAGEDVTFLVHARRRAQLRATGLVVEGPAGTFHAAQPHCVEAGAPGADYDVVVLGCKAYDLASAMDDIAPAVGADTVIVSLLNGLDHIDALTTRFGRPRVLGGVCQVSAALDGEGHIHQFSPFDRLVYGELDGALSARVRSIAAAFGKTKCTVHASSTILQDMWDKWIMIAAMAGSTCLLRGAVCDIVAAGAAPVVTGMLDEGAAIATANGFPPSAEHLSRTRAFLTKADSPLMASMLRDVERGARTEGAHILDGLLARSPRGAPEPRFLAVAAACLRTYEARRSREAGADHGKAG
ncbi:MAG TPA: ketopantoate reductase family protein [Nevskiaceae bacterium]